MSIYDFILPLHVLTGNVVSRKVLLKCEMQECEDLFKPIPDVVTIKNYQAEGIFDAAILFGN